MSDEDQIHNAWFTQREIDIICIALRNMRDGLQANASRDAFPEDMTISLVYAHEAHAILEKLGQTAEPDYTTGWEQLGGDSK